MFRTARKLAAPVALAALLTACSGGGDTSGETAGDTAASSTSDAGATGATGGSSTITLVAEGTRFDQSDVQASAGSVTFTLDNQDEGTPHNLHVVGNGVDAKTEVESGVVTQELTVELSPGTYDFRCDIHPSAMSGTITVA